LNAPSAAPLWETVALRDLSDCLLDAYNLISERAYQRYMQRGGRPGEELSDWLNAESELLRGIPVDIEEAPLYISALASVPAESAADVEVGIESRWLVILAHMRDAEDPLCDRAFRARKKSAAPAQVFNVIELPAEVDPESSIAVLSHGILGIRMLKKP
jgi:HSP20 family molecular chaperone IbpA